MNYVLYYCFRETKKERNSLIFYLITGPPLIISILGIVGLKLTFKHGQVVQMLQTRHQFECTKFFRSFGLEYDAIEKHYAYLAIDQIDQVKFPFIQRYVLLSCAIMFLDAGMGINRILPYGFQLYRQVNELLPIFIFGGINLLACFITVFFIVHRISRRVNTLGGYLFMTPLLIMITLYLKYQESQRQWLIFFCAVYIFFFELSVGTMVYLITTQMLPLKYLGYCNAFNWLANAAVLAIFSPHSSLTSIETAVYSFLAALGFVTLALYLPETKNTSKMELIFRANKLLIDTTQFQTIGDIVSSDSNQ